MPEKIATDWLSNLSQTAARRAHTAHMQLISSRVSLPGVPGFENIGYVDWSSQCKHEFENRLIDNIQYKGLKIRAATDSRIMFMTHETVTASDGTVNAQ